MLCKSFGKNDNAMLFLPKFCYILFFSDKEKVDHICEVFPLNGDIYYCPVGMIGL